MQDLVIPDKPVKISVLQVHSIPGEPEKNFIEAEKLINKAVLSGSDILVLPELWYSGYENDLNKMRERHNESAAVLSEISALAKKNKVNIAAGSFIIKENDNIYNRQIMFDRNGVESAHYDKMHLFAAFGEQEVFTAGKSLAAIDFEHSWKIGLMLCYDLRFPELARKYFNSGCNLLILPAQWPGLRWTHWETLLKARAIENQCFIAAANAAGNSDEKRLFGNSIIIDPWGETLSDTGQDAGIISSILYPERIKFAQDKLPIRRDINTNLQL